MADDFIDPLNDPRFPDRPSTPDFWRMSEVVLKNDGDDRGFDAIVAPLVDIDSLLYMAKERVQMATALGADPLAIFIDAFTMGVGFEKAGGHRA